MTDLAWHKQIGCYCEPLHEPSAVCSHCGETVNLGELHLPEYTMLCFVCETRFEVKH